MSASLHVVCPGCGATNRLPEDKPAKAARCGSCKAPLFAAKPLNVDGAAFQRHIASNDIAVLVDVWAPWCGPCRSMAPNFEAAAAELEPDVRLLKLNADEEGEIARQLGVSGIPALILFHGGRPVARTAGAMPARSIVDWTRQNLG
ncbi:thioredoxin TrxC [Microbaculum marinisediminis]|uniref:Thioredoxin n=1 Tax=Microbaculum marinisediminis TaxID=2931392 RepID=A0AAW5QYF8_9HYPH|nr:thioredoxin TrxC [Microbaculum sp. A6E488]MCT8972594.1 thioredoxin TrxC [Microbaculum sp. A6E488]